MKGKYTFKGGTHVEEHKNTAHCAIEKMPAPEKLSIPLSQHIGAPCTPTVKIGDSVTVGQMIGTVENALGCPVHSSVSGKVVAIDSRNNAQGVPIQNIIIENDGLFTLCEDVKPLECSFYELSADELIEKIRLGGVSGMGGAMFPTYAKIRSALGKVDHIIINCAECEPYITADCRVMIEHADKIIEGVKILKHIFGLDRAYIAVEDNKPESIESLKRAADGQNIEICVCKTKYPQGDERQLMFALTGRQLPPGKLPADMGCVFFNASSCVSIYNAVVLGMPLIERVVTVDGDCIKNPKNILAPIGASYKDLIDFAGGLVKDPHVLVSGGPMMGAAQWDINGSVIKGTSALLALSKDQFTFYNEPSVCIRCGRCVNNCPMHLMPNYLVRYARLGKYDEAEKLGVMACVECGTCSYNCPGHMMIVQHIRVAKGAIRAKNVKR